VPVSKANHPEGTQLDEWRRLSFMIDRYTEGGEWKVEEVVVRDKRPNERRYTFEQLGAAGLQNTFTG
jgi:hypothetical protein